jgi:hypothetical protein
MQLTARFSKGSVLLGFPRERCLLWKTEGGHSRENARPTSLLMIAALAHKRCDALALVLEPQYLPTAILAKVF